MYIVFFWCFWFCLGHIAKEGRCPSEKFTVRLPEIISGSIWFENILSIRVSFFVLILVGNEIRGLIKFDIILDRRRRGPMKSYTAVRPAVRDAGSQ